MPVVVTWDPSKDFKQFEKELFKNFVKNNCSTKVDPKEETPKDTQKETTWKPNADIYSEPDHYIISVDLPGVSKENISLTFEKGILTLKGERVQQLKDKTVRNEKQFGAFERKFKMTTEIIKTILFLLPSLLNNSKNLKFKRRPILPIIL